MPPARNAPAERFRELKQRLQTLEYFCKGTVLTRMMKCGQPGCPCHTDPARRHGPYWEWTYKHNRKTVNVRLPPAAGPLYQAAARQYRRLKSLLSRLERISRLALADLAAQATSQPNPAAVPPRRPKSMRH